MGMGKIYGLKMCAQTAAPSSLRKHMCRGLTVGGLGGTPRAWQKLVGTQCGNAHTQGCKSGNKYSLVVLQGL